MKKRKQKIVSEETMKGLQVLGEVLQRIHTRLVAEGVIDKDGKVIKEKRK